MKTHFGNWLNISFDAFQLSIEASNVVALRTAKMALGGKDARCEAELMIREKLVAMVEFQTAFLMSPAAKTPDAVARAALVHYGRKVRANRKRLKKPA